MQVTTHNDIDDYTFEERTALEAAFNSLEQQAQGGNLTIEETRIRVAYTRLKRNENFKISQTKVKAVKKVKELSLEETMAALCGEVLVKTRAKRVAKVKVVTGQAATLQRASQLFFRKQKGEVLSEEDEKFLEIALAEPEVL